MDYTPDFAKAYEIEKQKNENLIAENYALKANLERKAGQVSRRNMQIKELKKKVEDLTVRIKDVLELEPDISNAAKDTLRRGINR